MPRRLRRKQIVREPLMTRSASSSAVSERTERRASTSRPRRADSRSRSAARRAGAPSESTIANGLPAEPAGELHRVGDRRRGADEARLGAVDPGDPLQPPQHVGHVRAEHPAVGVGLVDDHAAQVGEEVSPALVVRQHRHVEHVRVGEHQVRAAPDPRAIVPRRVAVVDRVAELAAGRAPRAFAPGPERAPWSGRRRAPGLRVGGDRVEHREVERHRLARGRAAGDDHVPALGGLERLDLVRVQAVIPARTQRRDEVGGELRGRHGVGLARLGRRWLRPAVRRPHRPRAGAPTRQAGRRGAPRHARASTIAAAVRIASSALDVMEAQHLGAGVDGEAAAAAIVAGPRCSAPAALPRTRGDRSQEVLARERDEQRAPERAQLPEAMQDLDLVVRAQVEIEARVERDLLGVDAERGAALEPVREPLTEVVDDVPVRGRGALDPRRALDVHQHVATAAFGDQLEHLVLPAADVVDRHGPGVGGAARARTCRRRSA